MPFSDLRPPFIVPDTPQGTAFVHENGAEAYIARCGDYRPQQDEFVTRHDIMRSTEFRACARRFSGGDRKHNWCMACAAGFVHMYLDKRDDGLRERFVS